MHMYMYVMWRLHALRLWPYVLTVLILYIHACLNYVYTMYVTNMYMYMGNAVHVHVHCIRHVYV